MKQYTYIEYQEYIKECIKYLSNHHLPISSEILPYYLGNGSLAYHCFNQDEVSLSYEGCVDAKQTEILEKMFNVEIKLKDAVKLNNAQLVYLALSQHNYLDNNDLNEALKQWLRNIDSKDYYEIIFMLIDYGASLTKDNHSDDFITTNFLYKISKDFYKLYNEDLI